MEDRAMAVQRYTDARTFGFLYLCTQSSEQRFDISPCDICKGRDIKHGSKRLFVAGVHRA